MTITEILKLLQGIVDLEQKLEKAIAAEKDARRREKLLKACKERDLETIREILYSVD